MTDMRFHREHVSALVRIAADALREAHAYWERAETGPDANKVAEALNPGYPFEDRELLDLVHGLYGWAHTLAPSRSN